MEVGNSLNDQIPQQIIQQDIQQMTQGRGLVKKWLVVLFAVMVGLLVVGLIIGLIVVATNKGGMDRTKLMVLYEQLDDKMTYGELTDKIREVVPEASIIYDEGIYVIMAGEEEDDYITCAEVANGVGEEENIMEDDSTDEGMNSDEGLEKILAIDDAELDNEELVYDNTLIDVTPNVEPSVMMGYFVYSYIDVNGSDIGETAMEYSIQENYVDGGYDFSDGVGIVQLPTKTAAIDELLMKIR